MKEKKEYNIIFNYIKENFNTISDSEREFFIRYAASKFKLDPKESYSVNSQNFLKDLKSVIKTYKDCNETSLAKKRLSALNNLLNEYKKCENNISEEKMIELSMKLDKLCMDSGLNVRNTDTVLKRIKKLSEGYNKNARI